MNSFLHLWQALVLGCGLGLLYGFLRPFRPRWLGDLIFMAALFYGWVYLVFGLCGANPRLGYTVFLLGGCLLWDSTFGLLLRPVFSSFWKYFSRTFHRIWEPFKNTRKKIGIFINFLFARSKKWVTIKCNLHPSKRTENRRNTHGKAKPLPSDPTGL